jgi:hypothetical protein
MRVRTAFVFGAALLLLAACGSRSAGPASNAALPPPDEKADVTIFFDGSRHACVVSLASEAQGSSIPCKDVAAFVRDELRVASGSSYDLRMSGAEDAEVASVRASLKGAGYRSVGGRSADPR